MSARDDLTAPRPGRSWRNIRQEVTPLAMSRRGRRRQIFSWVKPGLAAAATLAVAWGGFMFVHEWDTDRAGLASALHSQPVGNLQLVTKAEIQTNDGIMTVDGVLTQSWVAGVLALPRSASLMSLDLPALRDKLLAHGQVRVAVLTRRFPATLLVTLRERTPVARVSASDGSGPPRQLLVAKDGVVYDGMNYDPKRLAGLPWLDGIRLVRSGNGYQAIEGMDAVASLLATARAEAPHLYRQWRIISLARLAERDEIVVQARDIPEIVFSRKRDFFHQIAQLDYVIDRALLLPEPGLKSVNLALNGQVPVQLAEPPADPVRNLPPKFSLQSSSSQNHRDL